MGELIRKMDWSKTSLGPPESWPQSLRTAVSIMLHNKFGMYIAWGKEFIQLYNDGFRPILGSTKHPAAMGNTPDQTFAESWHMIGPLFQDVMRGNAVSSEDWLLPLNRHGYLEDCYFTFSYSPIFDESGDVGGILFTVTETSARVKSERSIQEAGSQAEKEKIELQRLVAQAPVGIATLEGPDHIFTRTNSAYLKVLFGENRDLLGKPVRAALPEVMGQGFPELLDCVYRTGEPYMGDEVPLGLRQSDNSDKNFFINAIYQPIRNIQDKITGILCVVYDVSEQVQTRLKVAQSEECYRSLAESLPQMVWTSTAGGQMNYVNGRCLRFSGISTQEKFSEEWIKMIHPEDAARIVEAWAESIQTGKIFNSEYRIRRADGEYRWFVSRGVPIKSNDHVVQYWIGTMTDIEDQKRIIGKLQNEQQLREQFVATLTHDLRSPLTSAKMSAQLIGRFSNFPDKLPSLTGRIIDNINRADQMIQNLLDANQIKAGEPLRLERSEVELHSLIHDLIAELTTVFGNRFVVKSNQALFKGYWSSEAFRRILENLCSNAVKYGTDRTPITLHLSNDGENALISIHNFGLPIPPEELRELFEPYKRVHSLANRGIKGWGLGLTVVKGLVEAHGGELSVTSTAEEGTTFSMVIPKVNVA